MNPFPKAGSSVWWRFTPPPVGQPWKFGYVTYIGSGLIRLGEYVGDTKRGPVALPNEIEWRYRT